jgi:c-di-GMP-binding flagellar brake protein YcgR
MNNERNMQPDGNGGAALMPVSNGAERRNSLRVTPEVLSAMVIVDGHRHVVSIRDISTTGARIVNVPAGLKSGDRFVLVTRLEEDMVEVSCRVAHSKDSIISPVIGVEFIEVDGESTSRLLSYVCKLGIELIRG